MRPLLILALMASPLAADHCRQSHRFFETPAYVAVPAPIVFYSIGGTYQAAPAVPPQAQAAPAPHAPGVDPEYQEYLAWKAARAQAAPVSILSQKCASCHGAAATNVAARGGLKLESMTADDRLNAIEAIRSDRMPPNAKRQPLDGTTASKLIGELTQRPEKQPLPPEPKPAP
jgi:cytochrome c553